MTGQQTELLVFELDDQQFGVQTASVAEITRAVSYARLPKAPTIIEGVLNFRGTAIPLLDIRSRFGLPSKPLAVSDHLIVARAGDRTVAIRVNRTKAVLTVAGRDLDGMEGITRQGETIAGVARLPGEIILIHDLSKFLSAAEATQVDAFMKSPASTASSSPSAMT